MLSQLSDDFAMFFIGAAATGAFGVSSVDQGKCVVCQLYLACCSQQHISTVAGGLHP